MMDENDVKTILLILSLVGIIFMAFVIWVHDKLQKQNVQQLKAEHNQQIQNIVHRQEISKLEAELQQHKENERVCEQKLDQHNNRLYQLKTEQLLDRQQTSDELRHQKENLSRFGVDLTNTNTKVDQQADKIQRSELRMDSLDVHQQNQANQISEMRQMNDNNWKDQHSHNQIVDKRQLQLGYQMQGQSELNEERFANVASNQHRIDGTLSEHSNGIHSLQSNHDRLDERAHLLRRDVDFGRDQFQRALEHQNVQNLEFVSELEGQKARLSAQGDEFRDFHKRQLRFDEAISGRVYQNEAAIQAQAERGNIFTDILGTFSNGLFGSHSSGRRPKSILYNDDYFDVSPTNTYYNNSLTLPNSNNNLKLRSSWKRP